MRSFTDLELHSDRLLLRPLQQGDAEELFQIFSNPQVMRYWSHPAWETIASAREQIEQDEVELAEGDHLRVGIIRKQDEALIGTCSLFAFDIQNRRCEVGYALHPDAWHQGFMQEALGLLLNYAFDTLDLNRLEADIDPRNVASAKSLERLGFLQEGLLRQRWIVGSQVSDSALYGLLRDDWRSSKAKRER
jgi:RimJ/RimL family protein N-acetyltransferase